MKEHFSICRQERSIGQTRFESSSSQAWIMPFTWQRHREAKQVCEFSCHFLEGS
jgi:hypothetical protein